MIQLKLNWFGGQAENQLDKRDTKDDSIYSFIYKGVNYTIPTSTLQMGTSNRLDITNRDKAVGMEYFIRYFIDNNGDISNKTKDDFKTYLSNNNININEGAVTWDRFNSPEFLSTLRTDVNASTGTTGLTPTSGVNVDEAQLGAFNQYYQDVYSLAPGTGGAEMLGRLEQSYMNQAQQAATMADVGFQQAALQQAQTVKQITDQVRGESMARLRAGMSESQISNQDMQILMTNVNTLNQNAKMLNDQRLQAQIGINTAQDQAYTDFLAQANQRGQVASAMAASDAGDAYQQTIRQMTTLYGADPSKWTSAQWTETSNRVSTGNPAGNVTR